MVEDVIWENVIEVVIFVDTCEGIRCVSTGSREEMVWKECLDVVTH